MAAMWNRWYQRSYYYNNSCQLLTSIQSAVGMRKKPDEVKQFEQWYYNAPDKDRLAGYVNFRNQYPQYDSLLLQNPFIDFRFHGWYGTLGLSLIHISWRSLLSETSKFSSLLNSFRVRNSFRPFSCFILNFLKG